MSLVKLVLRVVVGGLMAGHGLQKLMGKFGGPGLAGTEASMAAIGMHPARHQARAAALTETVGGGLTAVGLFSPLGPAMIAGTMVVAMQKVHLKNGPWVTKGGYEYNLVLVAAALTMAAEGPGPLSLDGLLRRQRGGLRWAVAAGALAAGAAAATLQISDRFAPTGPEPAAAGAGAGAEEPIQ